MPIAELEPLRSEDLHHVTGGADPGAIGSQIGGLVDSFTGGTGKGAQIGGQIGSFVQSFVGGSRGQGGSGEGGGGGGGGGE